MYLVMLAETKTTISAYESENMLKQFALDIHNSQGNIRRTLTATKREISMVETHEENAQLRSLPKANLHTVYPLHHKGSTRLRSRHHPYIQRVLEGYDKLPPIERRDENETVPFNWWCKGPRLHQD